MQSMTSGAISNSKVEKVSPSTTSSNEVKNATVLVGSTETLLTEEHANDGVLVLRLSVKEPELDITELLGANMVVLESQLLAYFSFKSVRILAVQKIARRLSAIEHIRVTFQSVGAPKALAIESSLAAALQRAFDSTPTCFRPCIDVHEAYVEWQDGAVVLGHDSDSGPRIVIVAAAIATGFVFLVVVGLLVFLCRGQRKTISDKQEQTAPPFEAVEPEKITNGDDELASTATPASDDIALDGEMSICIGSPTTVHI
jgi:hypothetical protein